MPEHRRKFSPQFRAEAVQMVIETGKPIAEVARDLGIHDGTLGNWGVPRTRKGARDSEGSLKRCCVGDEGRLALRRRSAGRGVKPPHAALAEDRRGER